MESLKTPFRRNKSPRSASPTTTSRPASYHPSASTSLGSSTPTSSNAISGAPIAMSTGTSLTITTKTTSISSPVSGAQSVNPQLPATAVSMKNEAFERAIEQYINMLSDDDKAAFQSAPDIIERLQETQSRRKPLISTDLTARVAKVLQCVKHFMGSLSIFIQQSPQISSLIVGGINCILTLVLGYIEFFERITDMMERIGAHLAYLTRYCETSFQLSDQLQKVLVAAYCDLLDFYIQVRRVFSNKKGKPSYSDGFKLFLRLTWDPFEEQFTSIETRFMTNVNVVARLANVEFQDQIYKSLDHQRREDGIRKLREDEKHRLEADKKHRDILRWLSPDDFEEIHDKHFRKRYKGTGQWLLNDHRFVNWRDNAQSCLLWCHGAPGSGKTVLASLVIEHLSARYELSKALNTGVTFLYCNYKESRTPTTYIRLAMKQLCRRMQTLPSSLYELYKKHYKSDSQPRLEELMSTFLAATEQFNRVFLVLDALDECSLDQRKDLLSHIVELITAPNYSIKATGHGIVKLIITSRKEADIEHILLQKAFPIIEIQAVKVNSDIKIYVQAQVEQRLQDGRLGLRNMALKDKIVNALTTKAGGMFLWVEFQLEAICAEFCDDDIERALEKVPEDMDATYGRILNTINQKPRAQRELVRRVLIWTAYTLRLPLPISVLTFAMSIRTGPGSSEVLRSSIPNEKMIVSACANLISVDKAFPHNARFVHFSVQEFLTSHRSAVIEKLRMGYEEANREIAQTCITFLSIHSLRTFDSESEATGFQVHQLHEYAHGVWPSHLFAGNLNSLPIDHQMVTAISSFFAHSPSVRAYQLCFPIPGGFNKSGIIEFKFSPSTLALIFDLPGTAQKSHYSSDGNIGKRFKIEKSDYKSYIIDDAFAMHYAVGVLDSVPVAQRLYDHHYPTDYSLSGSDLDNSRLPERFMLTPFYSVQSPQMAEFLLDKGVSTEPQLLPRFLIDPLSDFIGDTDLKIKILQLLLDRVEDKHGERHKAAMHAAIEKGSLVAFQLLLDTDVDRNSHSGKYATVLQAAVNKGRVEAIQLLLDKGADVNAPAGKYGTALQAIQKGDSDTMLGVLQQLLDRGADVNAQGGKYGNALQAIARLGKVDAIRLLLDRGADVNAQGGEYGSALQAAASCGVVEPIQLLLDRGADVNAQGGEYGSALHIAANYPAFAYKIILLLLDNGANVNAQGGRYGTALQAAAASGSTSNIMNLLLARGADVNSQGGKYGSALQAAAATKDRNGFILVRLLLDHGADVNAQGGKYGSALQAAVRDAKIDVVELLLDKGANANIGGGEYGTALQAAAYDGVVEIMQLLIDKGADVNAQGGIYGNALQAAAVAGKVEAIQFLVENGANVNAQGGIYGNALQPVAFNVSAMEILLDAGADVNAQGGMLGSALQAAALQNNASAMRQLLDRGANVNTQGGRYGNALQAAAQTGTVQHIQLLLDRGADVNAQGGDYGTALQAAASNRSYDNSSVGAVRLLLDNGADVNAQGGAFGNALQGAAVIGNVRDIQLLLDRGANINAQGGKYGNALIAAAALGCLDALQLLLDTGVNINTQVGEYGNALQAAVYNCRAITTRSLLDHGVDVNAQGGIYGTALQAASYKCQFILVKLLLDKGAHVNTRGGKYGTALQAVLAPLPTKTSDLVYVSPSWKSLRHVSVIVEMLLDRGADITAYVEDSEYGDALTAAKELWKDDGATLLEFMNLLKSHGWTGSESPSKDNVLSASGEETDSGPGALQDLKKNEIVPSTGSGPAVLEHVWKLIVPIAVAFLILYISRIWGHGNPEI